MELAIVLSVIIATVIGVYLYREYQAKLKRKAINAANAEAKLKHLNLVVEYQEAWKAQDINEIVMSGYSLVDSQLSTSTELEFVYDNALTLISTDKKLKTYALKVGRCFYSKFRQGKSLTVYDEAAIQNDLYAAS